MNRKGIFDEKQNKRKRSFEVFVPFDDRPLKQKKAAILATYSLSLYMSPSGHNIAQINGSSCVV